MEPITAIRSLKVVMPSSNIDTDQIIPARFRTNTATFRIGVLCLALLVGAFLPGCIIVSNDYNDRPQFGKNCSLLLWIFRPCVAARPFA